MDIKHTLEGLEWTAKTVEFYQCMKQQTIAMYDGVDYSSDRLQRMIDFTNGMIKHEKKHHDYWIELINEIEDERYRNVLTLRYVKGMIREEVAEELFYTEKHIGRLTNKAIKELHHRHENKQFIQ